MSLLKGKLVRIIAVLALLAIVGMFALPYLIDVNRYRPLIQAQLTSKLGRDVTLGPMDLQVFPLAVKIQDFAISEDPRFGSAVPFASAKELNVRLGLFALLSGNVEVSSLTLETPKVEVIRGADGKWNFASLGGNQPAGDSAGPSIARLTVNDGTVGFLDRTEPKAKRSQYDHIDVSLSDYAPGKKYGITAEAHLPGDGKPSIAWSGTGQEKDVEGKIKLNNVTIASLRQFTDDPSLDDMDAVVTGDLDVVYGTAAAAAKGKVDVKNLRVRKSQLDFPIQLDIDAKQNPAQKLTEIQKLDVSVGGTKFSVAGSIRDDNAKLRLTTAKSPIAELLKLAAAFGAGLDPGMQAKGSLTADIAIDGPLKKPAYQGSLDISDLEVRNSGWKQPVRAAALKLALTPNEIRSTPFVIDAGGTKLNGNFALTAYTTDAAQIDAAVRAADASIEELLHVAQAFGAAAPGVSGSGLVDLDVQMRGSAKNPRLSGKGRIEKASLTVPGVSKPVTIPALDARFAENGVWIDQLNANLAGSNVTGKLSVQNFDAPNVQFALSMDRVDTSEMQKLFGAPESKSQSPSSVSKANGGGTISIGSLALNGIVLTQVSSKCTLTNGVLVLDPLQATLYGGGIQGRIVADLRPAVPLVTMNAKIANVDANSLVSATTSLKQTVFGKFNADTSLNLAANGADTAKSLDGTLAIRLQDGKIAGVNYLNEISKFARFFGFNAAPGKMTDFVKMGGTLKFNNGIAQTNDLDIQINGARISGSGVINLVSQTMDLRLGTVLDKAFSDNVGGSKIGGFMSTALTDERGQLVIPALVRGSFANPTVSPDAEQFAKLKLKGFANPANITNTKEAVQGVIDLFRKKKPEKK